ncbi:hypothetical protein [Planomonospora venezuelensis]|uniref:Uncharacterized protein n=1 Tax=Planomonospora venezuelensis TaxID=1999 RepID=A0A841DEN6_PLAVE|nr:hypothetical protein [Planomonospora venezuelensis]MBB5967939.1 hypothetical protein [Planomonospora venezuelensis]
MNTLISGCSSPIDAFSGRTSIDAAIGRLQDAAPLAEGRLYCYGCA